TVAGSILVYFARISALFAWFLLAHTAVSRIAAAKRLTRSGCSLAHADVVVHAESETSGAMASNGYPMTRKLLFACVRYGSVMIAASTRPAASAVGISENATSTNLTLDESPPFWSTQARAPYSLIVPRP